MENKYWHNIPDNDDNEEEELDCMTLAKAKKEQDILDEMEEDNDIEREDMRWEYAQEIRRDISRHRGLIDFDIDYDHEEFIKQTEDWGDE